jgi:hypothetical protein
VVFAAFVLNLSMFGQIFTITPSQNAFLVWGALALILAYTYHLKLVLVAGLTSLMGYLAATVAPGVVSTGFPLVNGLKIS